LQEPDLVDGKCFVIQGKGVSLADIKAAVADFGYEAIHSAEAQSLQYIVDRALLRDRLIAMFATFFGVIALLLAAVGVYGLISFEIQQRRRELGIRVALGAQPTRILAGVLSRGLLLTAVGLVIGLVGAAASVQLVRSLIFGISAHDPVTFIAAPLALLSMAAAACLGPALRASRTDPVATLRAE
jgi:ABC-type antimicrobial peptide transport system permease subunit